ncbi:MAG TPA: Nramp family divalent metal transporter [Actinomycetaceae bacterium]|nr:Nramp family divalent metal transporter [Actinomycetaceae bacterium]
MASLLGPAFVAAVAYVDPGNVAANITAGARYGYLLVWVLLLANIMAMLVQYLSAKLGLVTGESLPDVLGRRMRRGPRIAYWLQAELVAMATDLAEVIGGAIALWILFGIPLIWGGVIVGAVSMGLLVVQDRAGAKTFEQVITAMLVVIALGFTVGLFFGESDWGAAAQGLIPAFEGTETVLLAASMLGATVMPHAIYAHSSLVRDRHGSEIERAALPRLLKASRWDVFISLIVAGSVNMAMLLLAAGNLPGVPGTDTIEGAHAAIESALGPGIGLAFGIGLLFSGLASTSVGSYSGSVIMGGLLHFHIPKVLRRLITLIPALLVIASGVEATWSLVLSQVLLSVGIPFALIPLVSLTSNRELMGSNANSPRLQAVSWIVVGLIVALNLALVILVMLGVE